MHHRRLRLSLGVGYILFTTPIYTADARLLIDPRKKHTVGTEVVPSGLGENTAETFALVDSQVKVILSDAVLRPVVQSQHLALDPEFGAPREPGMFGTHLAGAGGSAFDRARPPRTTIPRSAPLPLSSST